MGDVSTTTEVTWLHEQQNTPLPETMDSKNACTYRDGPGPKSLSFVDVNNFVHLADAQYEELQWLCLSLARELADAR